MIDPPVPLVPVAEEPPTGPAGPSRVPAPVGRFAVLATVFVCAACGLVYELELVALASYLMGDSVTQASVVLSVMVFAMGTGSLLAKRLRVRAALAFGVVESLLALVGGASAMALYACFAWYGDTRLVIVGFSLAIGVLIGAEVPLLMTLIQRVRRQDAGGAVADLFAADYVGALVGGLAFPFLLLPRLGQLLGALLTGAVNVVVGGALVLWVFRRDLSPRERGTLIAANGLVLSLLASGAALTGQFEDAARRAVYGPDVRVAVHTDVQEVVITGGAGAEPGAGSAGAPLALYLDGELRVSARDEFRYHEALAHPAMAGPHGRVLVLGGGDGLAVREVLRYPGVRTVTVVELDGDVVDLARADPGLSRLNRRAFEDPRVRVVRADAFGWLRERGRPGGPSPGDQPGGGYDVVLSDLPAPGLTASTKLYSQEFYGLVRRVMRPGARLAVHAGTLDGRSRSYWTVDATVRSVGLRTVPYGVVGPHARHAERPGGVRGSGASGDWGFVLAARDRPALRLPAARPALRWLTPRALRAAHRRAERLHRPGAPTSTLMHPRYGTG
ncbi:polyamine aminopropyltransferase [Streptomyces sp. 71268]|uniref:polyamine aminopropyltransferase n=1 Tax=Streptomyces sp. 71268 TaxID=3002640 RepID=UPI0023F96EA3|nr:polyamine aminopropyltransferase [Streptomyces sp. 71268]WEV26297.1 polyamine aminopropyltransferase [Streptomyces sp. 71268]